jgi:uncharacterized protein (TIGR03382 family)
MTNLRTVAFAVALSGTISSAALAGPPPPTEAELFEMADVVADVETVSLDCAGLPVHGEYATVTSYEAQFQAVEILKGDAGEMLDYRVSSTEYEEGGEAGCSSPEYVLPEGWVGRVYLQDAGDGTYVITEFGGAVVDAEASIMHEVPTCEITSPGPDPQDPEADPDPQDPSAPTDPTDETNSGGQQVAGCSASGTAPNGSWFSLALAAAAVAGLRRRSGT